MKTLAQLLTSGTIPTVTPIQAIVIRQIGGNPTYIHFNSNVSSTRYAHKLQNTDLDAKYLSVSEFVATNMYCLGTAGDTFEVSWFK